MHYHWRLDFSITQRLAHWLVIYTVLFVQNLRECEDRF